MNQLLFGLLAVESKDAKDLGRILEDFLGIWWGPLIGAVAAASGIIALVIGLRFMLAHNSGDEQKIKQAKQAFLGTLIGIGIMFVLVVLVPVLIGVLQTWQESEAATVTFNDFVI